MPNPTDRIARSFRDLRDDAGSNGTDFSFAEWDGSRSTGWAELLQSQRVLIVSEAGVGKTYECSTQCKAQWDAGEPAFFFELASLATSSLGDQLSPEEQQRFDAWRVAQSDVATLFLDSIDELKLTLGSFKLALSKLSVKTQCSTPRWKMPDMDDSALWREVKARWPALARRMLFVTSDTLSPGARGFLAETRCPTLDKPFAKGDLLERVRGVLRG